MHADFDDILAGTIVFQLAPTKFSILIYFEEVFGDETFETAKADKR